MKTDTFFALLDSSGRRAVFHGTREACERHYFGNRQLPPPDLRRIGLGKASSFHDACRIILRLWPEASICSEY